VVLRIFVAHPVELLCEIVRTIDAGRPLLLWRWCLCAAGMLPSPVKMTADEDHAVSLMGGSLSGVRNALNALDGKPDSSVDSGRRLFMAFSNTRTVRDAFAAVIADDRELMDIYLAGAPVDRLFSEVTCGDVGVQGVKVIVPSDRL